MNHTDYVDRDLVLSSLSSTSKSEVLRELIAPVAFKSPDFDQESAYKVLMERESLGTTGIGDGVAIPHGKLEGLPEIILVVGRSKDGVDFDSLDFKPCTIFFMVLAPENVAGMHLRILAHISRLLKDEAFRDSFASAEDGDGLWDLLSKA